MSRQQRPIFIAIGAIALAWLLAWSGYVIFGHAKMTAEKVRQFQRSMDFAHLSEADRLKALKHLAEMLNALSPEERARWRLDLDWFRELSDNEKAFFIDAFMPGEMQLALKMFEKMPKEQQQKEIDSALKELRANAQNPRAGRENLMNSTNGPLLSPELDAKIRTIGLNALYTKGSAQTKADLAPLLIEVQHQLESGQLNMNRF